MSKIVELFKRKKTEHQRAIEPFSLSPNPMVQETKFMMLVALPFLAGLMVIIYIGRTYVVTQIEFGFMMAGVFGLWFCFVVIVYAWAISQASTFLLFDREFGYTERLHPRNEIYCKPEDIRELLKPEDELQKPENFEARLRKLDFEKDLIEKILKIVKNADKVSKYLYYFRHKDAYQGWDALRHEVPIFKTHMLLTDQPFDKQFIFGAGQENWFGPILYNHTHTESDNVKVMEWALDPFTNEPMPICQLIHSSVRYKNPHRENKDIEIENALGLLLAHHHGVIESQRLKLKHLGVLKESKFHDVEDIIQFGKDISKADRKLEDEIMAPTSRRLWTKGWFKALVTIVSIVAIVFIVAVVLEWIDLSVVFG